MTENFDYMTEYIGHFIHHNKGLIMLTPLLGSKGSENVLIFIMARDESYAREISQFFETDVSTVQDQLDKFGLGGILASYTKGRTRLYKFNPGYPHLKELRESLEKALSFYPEEQREKPTMNRRRPRRRGKDL